VLNNSIILLN